MKISVDIEGLLVEERASVVHRTTLGLTKALANDPREHEIELILSDLRDYRLDRGLSTLLPTRAPVRVYRSVAPVAANDPHNQWRRAAGTAVRLAFIESSAPDVVLLTSLFNGWDEDALASVDCRIGAIPTAVVLPELARVRAACAGSPDPRHQGFLDERLRQLASARAVFVGCAAHGDELRDMLRERCPEVVVVDLNPTRTGSDEPPSWSRSARAVLDALERMSGQNGRGCAPRHPARARLAFVSPLPPARSGIADYSADLLEPLSKHYEITAIHHQDDISEQSLPPECRLHTAEWFERNAQRFDRIVYQFGNSAFHEHMFDLIERFPGVAVLHDFYLGHVLAHNEQTAPGSARWTLALQRSHGYQAVSDRFGSDPGQAVWAYPCNSEVIDNALGVIVHSDYSVRLAEQWYGSGEGRDWARIPLLRIPPAAPVERAVARAAIGLPESALVVCSFGAITENKLNHRIVDAWCGSKLASDPNCHLVFVGSMHPGDYGKQVQAAIDRSAARARITVTGFVSRELYQAYLSTADIAVQLRSQTRGETSAAALDCMSYGIATIVNAHGSMAELPGDTVLSLPDEVSDAELAEALESLRASEATRSALATAAASWIRQHHSPTRVAELYLDAIEHAYSTGRSAARRRAIASVAAVAGTASPGDLLEIASCIDASLPSGLGRKRLFVDISTLHEGDSKTGIQRVTRAVLRNLLISPPHGYIVEPVYATAAAGFRLARGFGRRMLGAAPAANHDDPVEIKAGDIFLALDYTGPVYLQHASSLDASRRRGATVYTVLYDVLPILHPEYFPAGPTAGFGRWLEAALRISDGIIAISRSVADEVMAWAGDQQIPRHSPVRIGWFHLGSDIDASHPSAGLSSENDEKIHRILSRPSVLMVGTLEPRKGHDEVLAAFESLWAAGHESCLVIAGREGWHMESFARRLRGHPEQGRRLFWLEGPSDEELIRLYEGCTGSLVASRAEGFGLPLVEAAEHDIPILARDIPVFREVAGAFATYFQDASPGPLGETIATWLDAIEKTEAPRPRDMPRLSWENSTDELMRLIMDPAHRRWVHEASFSAGLSPGETVAHDASIVHWQGWAQPETRHRWSTEQRASIRFTLRGGTEWENRITVFGSTLGKQRIRVELNGVELADQVMKMTQEGWRIALRGGVRFIADDDYELVFHFPDARPPCEADRRSLALCLQSIEIQ